MKNFSVALLTCLLFTCSLLWAQDFRRWEPADGVAVRQGHHVEWYRSSAYQSEGEFAGEAAVAWSDTRQGERNIFLQVYDAEGEPRFLENGLQITSSPVRQENPIVVSCVDGGWFVTWERIVPEMQGQLLSDYRRSFHQVQFRNKGHQGISYLLLTRGIPPYAREGSV